MLTAMDQNLRKKVKIMMTTMKMVVVLKTLKGMKILDQMHKRENYKVLMRLIMRMVLKRKHMMVSCQRKLKVMRMAVMLMSMRMITM